LRFAKGAAIMLRHNIIDVEDRTFTMAQGKAIAAIRDQFNSTPIFVYID
jgi:hypothetical protein